MIKFSCIYIFIFWSILNLQLHAYLILNAVIFNMVLDLLKCIVARYVYENHDLFGSYHVVDDSDHFTLVHAQHHGG